MGALAKKEKEMMDHLEALIHHCVFSQKHPGMDVCKKAEITMIEILGRSGPLIMSQIADRANLSLSTATGLVDCLVSKGLVKRERSEEDRRIVRIELTSEGQNIYEQALQVRLHLVQGMLGALNKEEQETLVHLFRKIAGSIERERRQTVA
jgi:DNA-binding MarR family transcriptional regulator